MTTDKQSLNKILGLNSHGTILLRLRQDPYLFFTPDCRLHTQQVDTKSLDVFKYP